MDMNRNEMPEAMQRFSLPEYRDIPDVGLYLDQVVKYINRILTDFPHLQVTGSMIANYVKQKVIPKAVRKAYSKEQISMLVIIVMAKRVLSIEQIRTVLNRLNGAFAFPPEEYYTHFRNDLQAAISETPFPESNDDTRLMLESLAAGIVHGMYLDCMLAEKPE